MGVGELRLRLEHEQAALPFSETQLARLKPDYARVEQALEWQQQASNHSIISFSDPLYPPLLRQIPDPPPILFVKGQAETLLLPSLAVVGSRNASPAGLQLSRRLAAELVEQGLAICSGMATGIDGAAHKAALAQGGTTIAVLGTGIENVYPKRHQQLYQDIQQQGCVISEFWPDTAPFAGNFPKRNRIISGLSLGVLVVEACRKSGSLITARLASEQGREVFAVPGSVVGGHSQGCHDLLRNGASLVETGADIIQELASLYQFHLEDVRMRHHITEECRMCDLPFASLLASVGYETTSLDAVVEHSGKTIDLVLEQMLELELQGWVAAVPGGYVRLKRK
ncbi:DNA-processing protein DprA [Shewanella sp. AS16]|uniref:DNA-processing protein DprA n=1 Tax=Shewanella sp. AS16 TaxID=2907625 RepID=UPI001F45DFAA|nr:DNA-processing protein DprA [Shewanella sp. AS16]MCE9688056.1 DNA-processing protein DprA [Shewanella sp. AS16]